MQLSYWELKNWFTNVDYTIVGSGIVGLHCALALRDRFPSSKILVLEKGILPQGASTKNAGFACFGSVSEIIDDLKTHTEEEIIQLVQKRVQGLKLLRNRLGDEVIDFKPYGAYELFLNNDEPFYNECLEKLPFINDVLWPLFKADVFAKEALLFDGIYKTITSKTLQTSEFTSGILEKVQHGYNQKLSGDVIVIPTPGTISRGKTGTTHGSAYSYDTHVPILFYGAGIKNGLSHKDYNVRDIAPTIATLLGVEFTNANTGKVIEEALK